MFLCLFLILLLILVRDGGDHGLSLGVQKDGETSRVATADPQVVDSCGAVYQNARLDGVKGAARYLGADKTFGVSLFTKYLSENIIL